MRLDYIFLNIDMMWLGLSLSPFTKPKRITSPKRDTLYHCLRGINPKMQPPRNQAGQTLLVLSFFFTEQKRNIQFRRNPYKPGLPLATSTRPNKEGVHCSGAYVAIDPNITS